jgi:uncharacterized protein YndB with AHSA1/START domain
MKRDLVLEAFYAETPELVWRALTEPALLGEWLMENDFSPVVGAKCIFRMKPMPGFDGNIRCEVIEVEPPRRLVYTWEGGSDWGKTTIVWSLYPDSGGTRLRLEHRGFAGFRPFLLSLMMEPGWRKKLLKQVPMIVARLAAIDAVPRPIS